MRPVVVIRGNCIRRTPADATSLLQYKIQIQRRKCRLTSNMHRNTHHLKCKSAEIIEQTMWFFLIVENKYYLVGQSQT